MFDLEQSIREWRWQMLGDGIGSPVPLEELEVHLREDIEQRVKSGLNQKKAYKAAVREIGQGGALQIEFKKVASPSKIKRAALLLAGWLTTGLLLLYSMLCLEINWNLFSFSPRWNQTAFVQIFTIATVLTGIWFLAKASRDRVSRGGSLLACLVLAGIGIFNFLLSDPLHGGSLSPFWFRGSLAGLLCLPTIFWMRFEWKRIVQKSGSMQENKLIRLR